MGAIERIRCESCGRSWECKTGCGRLHGELDTVLKLFPEDIRTEVKKQVGQQMFPRFQFAYKTACCENCESVVAVPVLELTKLGLKYVGSCTKCQREISPVRIEQMHCQVCVKEQIETKIVGIWH